MKRIILLLLLIFPVLAGAQNTEHIRFMNIPVTGNIHDFIIKMEAKGFSRGVYISDLDTVVSKGIDFENNTQAMHGIFANMKCTVYITFSPNTKNVYMVTPQIDKTYTSWKEMTDLYFELKKNYVIKYGEPIDVKEVNPPSYYNIDHKGEFDFLNDERFKYTSQFKLKNGIIGLSIVGNADKPVVGLCYMDASGYLENQKFINKSIQNDI